MLSKLNLQMLSGAVLLAVAMACGSHFLEATLAAVQKYSLNFSDVMSAAFSMTVGVSLFSFGTILKSKDNPFKLEHYTPNLICAALSAVIVYMFFFILKDMNLFEFKSILLLTNVLIIIAGGILFGENLNRYVLIGGALCFGGAIIVAKANTPHFTAASILMFFHVGLVTARVIFRKIAAKTTSKDTILFYDSIPKLLIFTGIWLFSPNVELFWPLVLVGMCYGVSKWLYIYALKIGTAAILGATGFLQALFALGYDIALFDKHPALSDIIGAVIILGGVLMVTLQQRTGTGKKNPS